MTFDAETPSDMEVLRRRSIVANHDRPDDPVFDPKDYANEFTE